MSSKPQLDVCHYNQWWLHLVNAYEVVPLTYTWPHWDVMLVWMRGNIEKN